ncbi:putative peptidoglycan lipid II flippase [Sinosporangium album]|uniref:Putative peptidoglycan lipid II flippase n=1 Tax=Sinosporangium album TaxID=504805 RepID=A0A1G7WGI5_9ACTN|nr:lipid II flippase MurJ [Sinosporangium album]SDG71083.1 putative peptidoglycan lipid II flippase [Sinosporangium album]
MAAPPVRRLGQGIAGAAVLVGVLTVLARITGFGKQLAFAQTVGTDCLSTAYFTANAIPNLVFEIVVGGALAGMVVPLLAGPASRPGDPEAKAEIGETTSALLTWVLVLLVPLAVLTALVAGPIAGLFLGGDASTCDPEALAQVTARMLVVFAPQIPLYGLAVVLYGVLQAHHRFTFPALAPLVSSLVVIVGYLAFVPLSGGDTGLRREVGPGELALSVGTSLGVLALVVTVVGPASRLRLRLRPRLRFPASVAGRVRTLAFAGLAALLAQQAATALVVWLANTQVGAGGLAAYNFAWAIYQVPYAVLAVPIATGAFPALVARADGGDEAGFAAVAAGTTRAVVLVSGLAAGALAAVAAPAAQVFIKDPSAVVGVDEFARAVALFAPGLVGYGLMAHLSRVLYARGLGRAAAGGTVAGWVVAMAAQALFAVILPGDWKLAGLGLGGSVGMTVGAAVLLVSVVRTAGGPAAEGLGRAFLAALAGGAAGFAAGGLVAAWSAPVGGWSGGVVTALAGAVALAAGGAAALVVDRRDAAAMVSRFARRNA